MEVVQPSSQQKSSTAFSPCKLIIRIASFKSTQSTISLCRSGNTQQPHLGRPHFNKYDDTSRAHIVAHNQYDSLGVSCHTADPDPDEPGCLGDPGGPLTKKKPLPQFLFDSDEEMDEEMDENEQLSFGYLNEERKVDESSNTSLSNQSKFGGDDGEQDGDDEEDHEEEKEEEEEEQEEEKEDVDYAGRGRMDCLMDRGHGYQLRQNMNREAFKGSGFTDHDLTGNYYPGEESDEELEVEMEGRGRNRRSDTEKKSDQRKAKTIVKPNKSVRRKRERQKGDDEMHEDQNMADGSQNGVVEDGDRALSAIGGLNLDASPQPQEDDEGGGSSDFDLDAQDLAANSDLDPEEVRMRKAAIKRRPRPPAAEPKRQSCRFCKSRALDCSIQVDPTSYPCLACLETSMDCIVSTRYTGAQRSAYKHAQAKERKKAKKAQEAKLVWEREIEKEANKRLRELKQRLREAARNRACNHCKDDGTMCSLEKLRENETTGASCKRCIKHGHICTVELPSALDDALTEPWKARAPCQRPEAGMFGKAALGRNDDDGANPPCKFNSADGEPRPKRKRDHKPPQKSRKKSCLSNEIDPEISLHDSYLIPPGYSMKQITTAFCHPLVFNAPLPKGDEFNMACDFHFVAFSIFGLPSASPWVTYPDPPTSSQHPWQYSEIPVSGRNPGSIEHEMTNVCKECTYVRQKILFCRDHELAGIKGLPKPQDFDFDAAYAALLSDQKRNFSTNAAAQHKWCAICPAPAFIECCAPFTTGTEQNEPEGCGLMVCEICAVSFLTSPAPGLVPPEGLHVAQAQGEIVTEHEATKEVASLIQDVRRINIEATSLRFMGPTSQFRQRKGIEARRSLEDVIEEAKMAVRAGGGKGGKYQDGVRADVEFISRRGWLWEWMDMKQKGELERNMGK